MKVLVLGGAGFVGRQVVIALQEAGLQVCVASRSISTVPGCEVVKADATRPDTLVRAMQGCDAVVNCVTGSANSIVRSAHGVLNAIRSSRCGILIHMSSMAAYGDILGDVMDDTPLGLGGGWYAQAKREAESVLAQAAQEGCKVVMLRPGCVYGPGSHLWLLRVAKWLHQGRLGDLGAAGDGWSNLVHINDVAQAVLAGLRISPGPLLCANLSAPDSPRWNGYFIALAKALGATPVRRIGPQQLKLDAYIAAAPLRAWERVAPRLGLSAQWSPPALPPSLLSLFSQGRRLRSEVIVREMGLSWTPFELGVLQSANWYREKINGK